MPNNGIISRQAVIQSEFLVESAEPTDLVIINTPTTGNKVQQKAVPVSALGGGVALPYYSFVYKLHLLLDLSDASETVYNSFPEDYDLFVDVIPGTNSGDTAIVEIIDNNNVLEFTKVSVVIDSCLSPRIYIDEKNSTNVIIRLNNSSSGGKGAQLLIDQYVLFEIKYYY
jgi:hypothetical protein